ncbi:hypothetical protein EC968_004932 [Mortierella alpina]|nr:hypothetical protein EC968_004932 [Mortierella alpina]
MTRNPTTTTTTADDDLRRALAAYRPTLQTPPQQPLPPASNSTSGSDTRRRLIRNLRNSHAAAQTPCTTTAHPAPQQPTRSAASGTATMAAAPTTSSRPTAAPSAGTGLAGSAAAAASNASPMPLTTPTFTPSTPIVTPSTATASATNSPRFTSASTTTPAANVASNTTGASTSGTPATPPLFGPSAPSAANPFRFFGQGTATTSTAASTPTAGGFSFGQPAIGVTAASTPTAGSLFARGAATATAAATTTTTTTSTSSFASGLFGTPPSALTAANNSVAGGLFGQSTATVTPSTATAWTVTTGPNLTGLFGSTESLSRLTNAHHNSGRMSVNLDMTWSAAMVANAEKSFTAPFNIKTEKPEDISISCVVKAVEDTFLFQIQFPSLEVMERFDWVKSAIVLGMHRRSPSATAVTRPIEAKCLPATHDSSLFAASIVLYSSEPAKFTVPLFTALPNTLFGPRRTPTYCETILGRMLDDHASHDVFFEFENPFEDLQQVIESEIKTDHSDEIDDGNRSSDPKAVQDEQCSEAPAENNPPAETTEDSTATKPATVTETNISSHRNNNNNNNNNSSSNNSGSSGHADQISTTTSGKQSIGAHKIVLSQVEYFQTMFSSSFAEGGPGVKKILIKDADIHCFRVLIEFIYLGELRPLSIPRFLTEDHPQAPQDPTPTWEDLYLLADRYNILPLREIAGIRILSGLHASWAVPFLFRTAYLFEELRPHVIKFVVKNCVLMIVQKKVQQDYFDHPECSAIFGEIITELSSVRT